MPQLVIVRHGQTDYNAEPRYQGQLDVPLNDTGIAQAKATAVQIAALNPGVIVTSPLQRAAHTASEIAALTDLTPITDADLMEVDVGAWAGLSFAEVPERFPEEHAAFEAGEGVRRGGGETKAELGERGANAMRRVMKQYTDTPVIVIVAHGLLIKHSLLRLVADGDITFDGEPPHLGNAEWVSVTY